MISKPLLTTGRNPTLIFPLTFTLLVLFLLYLILAECELEFRRKFVFINLQNRNEIYKMKLLLEHYYETFLAWLIASQPAFKVNDRNNRII